MSLEKIIQEQREEAFDEFEVMQIQNEMATVIHTVDGLSSKITTLESLIDQLQMKVYNRG